MKKRKTFLITAICFFLILTVVFAVIFRTKSELGEEIKDFLTFSKQNESVSVESQDPYEDVTERYLIRAYDGQTYRFDTFNNLYQPYVGSFEDWALFNGTYAQSVVVTINAKGEMLFQDDPPTMGMHVGEVAPEGGKKYAFFYKVISESGWSDEYYMMDDTAFSLYFDSTITELARTAVNGVWSLDADDFGEVYMLGNTEDHPQFIKLFCFEAEPI